MKAWVRQQFDVFKSNMTPASWIASICMSVIVDLITGDKTNPRSAVEHISFVALIVIGLAAIVVVVREMLQTHFVHPYAPVFRRLARDTFGVQDFHEAQALYLRINDALFVAGETQRLSDLRTCVRSPRFADRGTWNGILTPRT